MKKILLISLLFANFCFGQNQKLNVSFCGKIPRL